MSDKVWIVRCGCYSDQWIAGAFSSGAKAEQYADAVNAEHKDGDYADVEEYELDPEFIGQGLKGWEVALSASGDILAIEPREKLARSVTRTTAAGIFVSCFAKTEAEAKKIATERRQELAAREAMRPTPEPGAAPSEDKP